ncbi:MAG: hypothetical protein M3001_09400, partial [Staphylococcus epidermidis]|nr:hypothetical protein [Staphylococcus epidermidis]
MNQSNLFNPKMKIYNLSFFILHFMAFIFSDSLINNYNLKISALILLISLFEIFLLIIFKFSTIFFITFLTSYLLLPLTIVSYNMTNSNLGIITLNLVPIHLEECIYDVYLFIFFFSFFCYLLNFQKKERMFINMNGIDLSNLSIL